MSDSTAGEPARINQPTKEGRGYTPRRARGGHMAAVTAVLFAVRAITPAWLRGGPERRRSKHPVIFLAMMAALVAAVIGVPQGLSSPSAALAQSSCATPTIELERHAEGFGITFTTEQAGISPIGYRYQYVRSGANYTPSEWVEVSARRRPYRGIGLVGERNREWPDAPYRVRRSCPCAVWRKPDQRFGGDGNRDHGEDPDVQPDPDKDGSPISRTCRG